MSNWQPIETAPEDGTDVLVWTPYEERPVIATFDTDSGAWRECETFSAWTPGAEPTFWMPLPEPPGA